MIFRIVNHHVSYRIASAQTRYTLITYIGGSDNSSIRQISPIIKFQVRLFILNQWMKTCSIQLNFKDIPTSIVTELRKHHPVTIPMQTQVRNRRIELWLINLTHIHLSPQIRQFYNRSIETTTPRRPLIRPVIVLGTQLRSHRITCTLP